MLLINARLSERSARRYRRFQNSIRPVLAALAGTGAQTTADAERLAALGADPIAVTGNLKFDVQINPNLQTLGREWRSQLNLKRPVWLAASTREGEEILVLEAHRMLCERLPDLNPLLVLVPRHPQRFNEIAAQIQQANFRLRRRSEAPPDEQTQIWLGDSMGEMVAYYSMADLALIGGSLLPFGGQNLIEAAACGTPLIMGPHTYNFQLAAEMAEQLGAAYRLDTVSSEMLSDVVGSLLLDKARLRQAREATVHFVQGATGATERTCALIRPLQV